MSIVKRTRTRLSPWVTLVERQVKNDQSPDDQIYHSLDQADYVTILALTEDNKVPLVRQFRPAVERVTLELPGGLLDAGSTPEETAKNELYEETGYTVSGPLTNLGCLVPDTGRLENRFWGFFASSVTHDHNWRAENGVEPVLMPTDTFKSAVTEGNFTHALHIALVGLAVMKGLF